MKLAEVLPRLSLRDLRRAADAWGVDVLQHDDPQEHVNQILSASDQFISGGVLEPNVRLADLPYHTRAMAKLALRELLDEPGYSSPVDRFHERLITDEQRFLEYARDPHALKHLDRKTVDLYRAVLRAFWDGGKDRADTRLLEVLRNELGITRRDHRVIEVQLGFFPSATGGAHTGPEVEEALHHLLRKGLTLIYRSEDGTRWYVVPEEIAGYLRSTLHIELRAPQYRALMQHLPVRTLRDALAAARQPFAGTREFLTDRLIDGYVSPTEPLRLLSQEELDALLAHLPVRQDGSREIRVRNVIRYFDQLAVDAPAGASADPIATYLHNYQALARRQYNALRAAGVISKDKDVDRAFELATVRLFQSLLGYALEPYEGSNHPDGRALVDDPHRVLLWDCKSCETDYALTDRLSRQFLAYATAASPAVASPLLVIAPAFSEGSVDAIVRLKVQCPPGTEIALITADDLLWLAERWSKRGPEQGRRSLPWEVLATTGLLDRTILQKRLKTFA
jgi:hypothetical protein